MSAVSAYSRVSRGSEVESADPHRLIQMLIDGALEKMVIARSAMERKEVARKGEHISWAISIVNGLQASLDKNAGGDIASNLDSLYDYISLRLVAANAQNDTAILDETIGLMRTIKEGWDGIRPQALAMQKPAPEAVAP
jgi:flagellar protein FliS